MVLIKDARSVVIIYELKNKQKKMLTNIVGSRCHMRASHQSWYYIKHLISGRCRRYCWMELISYFGNAFVFSLRASCSIKLNNFLISYYAENNSQILTAEKLPNIHLRFLSQHCTTILIQKNLLIFARRS